MRVLVLIGLSLSILATGAWAAQTPTDGVTAKEVLVGQCAAFSGPAAPLGKSLNIGLKAAFEEANAKGGIHGRAVRLVSADDGFRAEMAVELAVRLIEEQRVFALIGATGTACSAALGQVAERKRVPVVGMMSGDPALRPEEARFLFPVRPTWDEEAETLLEHLVKDRKIERIGLCVPNDAYGSAALAGVEKALRRRSLKLAVRVAYPAGTIAIQRAFTVIREGNPEAVVVVGPFQSVAAFTRECRTAGFKPLLATLSFVNTELLIKDLGADAEGFIIAQVVPAPDDLALPPVTEFRSALKKSAPAEAPTVAAFEGYFFGRVFLLALDRVGPDLNREAFASAMDDVVNNALRGARRIFLTQVTGGVATTLEQVKKP